MKRFCAQFGQELFLAEGDFWAGAGTGSEEPHRLRYRAGAQHRLWQKEQLLNNLLARLPREFTAVAWIDADVLLTDRRWKERALDALRQHPVIQLFDTVVHLDANGFPKLQYAGIMAASKGEITTALESRSGASGFAWAARRDVLESVGFLDRMVLGGADAYMAGGFSGGLPASMDALLTPKHAAYVKEWSAKARVATEGRVGCVAGTIEHLFHGELATRSYLQRYEILRRASYDPAKDVISDADGLLAWASPKPKFHAEVDRYFQKRAVLENP